MIAELSTETARARRSPHEFCRHPEAPNFNCLERANVREAVNQLSECRRRKRVLSVSERSRPEAIKRIQRRSMTAAAARLLMVLRVWQELPDGGSELAVWC
jgi:hypothetical protein